MTSYLSLLALAAPLRMEQPSFANGRSVRSDLDRLRMRHAIRLWEGAVSADELSNEEEVLALGAVWEGEELVTYDLPTLRLHPASEADDYINDND